MIVDAILDAPGYHFRCIFMIFDGILNGFRGVILEQFSMILVVMLDGFWHISDVLTLSVSPAG